MRFMYVGPELAVEVFATVFPKGQAVEVTDPHAIKKLGGHPEFASDAPAAAPTPSKKAKDAN